MTHDRFLRSIACPSGIPADVRIIVDEQLQLWTDFEILSSMFSVFESCFGNTFGSHLLKSLKLTKEKGCYRDNTYYEDGSLWQKVTKFINTANVNPDEASKCLAYVQFFFGEAERYVMRDNARRCWRKKRIVLDIPNTVLCLDASADYQPVTLDGFTIVRLKEQASLSFHNHVIHVISGNPTATHTSRTWDGFRQIVTNGVNALHAPSIFIAMSKSDKNKTLNDKVDELAKDFRAKGYEVKTGNRGADTRGSNQFADCDTGVIAMPLFTTIADYALEAAVVDGKDVPSGDIWCKGQDGRLHPRMHKGFVAERLNRAFSRRYADEFVQTVLRTKMRRHDGNCCHIWGQLPSFSTLVHIHKALPGIRFEGNDPTVKTWNLLESLTKTQLLDISLNDILKQTGIAKNKDTLKETEKALWCYLMK